MVSRLATTRGTEQAGGSYRYKEEALNSRKTRYAEVAVHLERQIAAGDFASGTLLPTEAALCETYGISRFTARAALKSLAEKGLIERRQGRGSVVLNARPSVFRRAGLRSHQCRF